ncbi:MAG: hypothetical protein AB7G87_01295 [Clostridia bacterium]
MNSTIAVLGLSILIIIGLLMILFSVFWLTITSNMKSSSSYFTHRFQQLISDNVSKNRFFFKDRITVERQLAFSGLKFRGIDVDFNTLTYMSLVSAVLGFIIAFITTTRDHNFNIIALLTLTIVGFIIPRWYLIIVDGRMQRHLSMEAPVAIAKITSFARSYSNIERAVFEATDELPKTTRKFFMQAWKRKDYGEYTNFTAMMYALSHQCKISTWSDFAHLCLVEQTLGSSDKLSKLRSIQSRARRLLLASKVERKNLNAKALKIGIAYFFLLLIWIWDVFISPATGDYLYSTAIGRMLLTAVYVTFTLNVALFTWLYYDA